MRPYRILGATALLHPAKLLLPDGWNGSRKSNSAMNRRDFLTAATAAAAATLIACERGRDAIDGVRRVTSRSAGEWEAVRRQFNLSPDYIQMSSMLITSHPAPVRHAIDRYRLELDRTPAVTLEDENSRRRQRVLDSASRYLGGVTSSDVALTDSTTQGVGLVYNGIRLAPGDEVLTTEHDYYVTHESLRYAAARTGARVRRVRLFQEASQTSSDELVENLRRAISPATRVVALTWVQSNTGMKFPIRQISEVVAAANQGRSGDDAILLCVDGVHGFGIENVTMQELGCDFFMAGCHKWLFGPRGTGIVWGSERGYARLLPTIPTFIETESWSAWIRGETPPGRTNGLRLSPGGFKAFEHQWAMNEAFDFHLEIGKDAIEKRTHELASQLKEGLASMPNVSVVTPMSPSLSSGIVSFDVSGRSPASVVSRLMERRIVASVAPYAVEHARLTPSIRNTPEEIEQVLREIRELG
jgi:isopenicillin-N epimerase